MGVPAPPINLFKVSSWLTALRIIRLRDHALLPPFPLDGAGGGAKGAWGEAGLAVLAVPTDGDDGMVMDKGGRNPSLSSFFWDNWLSDRRVAPSLLMISTSLLTTLLCASSLHRGPLPALLTG